MRFPVALTLLLTSGLALADQQALEAEARALILPFAQALQDTVKQALAEGGPQSAVQACQSLAPTIAEKHSREPWIVGRTALKVRNPANRPDAWERQVLERFAAAAAAGQPVAGLKHGEVIDGEYRYLQAIPTGEPCLACHGKNIDKALLATLDERYPQDQAQGFALGELRGAFTLRRPLDGMAP
ncbi:Tll0287-like domain-containing protein [Azotobacter armeniacus]